MTWLKGADAPLTPSPWLPDRQRPKIILECALKTAGLSKKCFHVLFKVLITNEISVTLL